MPQKDEQTEIKTTDESPINRETQIAIMKFFLHTSIPRILKQREIEAISKDIVEPEGNNV